MGKVGHTEGKAYTRDGYTVTHKRCPDASGGIGVLPLVGNAIRSQIRVGNGIDVMTDGGSREREYDQLATFQVGKVNDRICSVAVVSLTREFTPICGKQCKITLDCRVSLGVHGHATLGQNKVCG